MSAYAGNYSKPGYGAAGGDDSGGFFAGGSSQQGSQGGGKVYQDESLRPVTIKQILDAEESASGDFKIDGHPITQITFVGQVRSVNPQPTNTTLKIDDGTGQLEVKRWVDADKQDDPAETNWELDSHVRVWGRLKSFSSKRYMGGHVIIRPVADYNEVNYHMLEATYVHLYYTKGPPEQQGGTGGEGDSMFVDGGAGAGGGANSAMASKVAGCTPAAKKMFQFMNNTPGGNEGVHLNVITNGTGLSTRDVMNASDELLGNGLIYTTVDDETWAILEF